VARQYVTSCSAKKLSARRRAASLQLFVPAFASLLLFAGNGASAEEAPDQSVLDGVFSQAQVGRGRNAYRRYCADCHLANLQGDGIEPPLTGSLFIDAWREDYIASLYDFIQTRMPKGRENEPGSLKEKEYLDILAYVLSENEFPTGTKELTMEDLGKVVLTGHDGPAPLPPTALGRVVGCFKTDGTAFSLTNATGPSRVREADETNEAEVEKSATALLGTSSYTLNNLEFVIPKDSSGAFAGKKVQAKGVINLESSPPRIHVLLLTDTGQACEL
jgi:S-disulfanyl-L-cysteine oxidoreductase SoxD